MPRYFYHPCTPDGRELTDDVGSVFEGDEAALEEAIGSVLDLTRMAPSDWRGCSFRIVDEGGRHVVTVQFDEVLARYRSHPVRRRTSRATGSTAVIAPLIVIAASMLADVAPHIL